MANKSIGIRINNPNGGTASAIFNTPNQGDQPRLVRDHQKSSIFGTDQPDGAKRNFLSPRYQDNTQQRLFGENDSQRSASPRRLNDTWRSNLVFSASADSLSDQVRTPRRSPSARINPITGELLGTGKHENGVCTPYSNGIRNGLTDNDECDATINGKVNGQVHNGQKNGKNGEVTNRRQPPGGMANGIF